MAASQTIAFSRLILPLMQNLLPFAHHHNQSYLSPSLLTKLSNPDATIVLQYMVVYQCVLATVNAAAFCVDGSSTSNLQVRSRPDSHTVLITAYTFCLSDARVWLFQANLMIGMMCIDVLGQAGPSIAGSMRLRCNLGQRSATNMLAHTCPAPHCIGMYQSLRHCKPRITVNRNFSTKF